MSIENVGNPDRFLYAAISSPEHAAAVLQAAAKFSTRTALVAMELDFKDEANQHIFAAKVQAEDAEVQASLRTVSIFEHDFTPRTLEEIKTELIDPALAKGEVGLVIEGPISFDLQQVWKRASKIEKKQNK